MLRLLCNNINNEIRYNVEGSFGSLLSSRSCINVSNKVIGKIKGKKLTVKSDI